jgi:hypothetical protein
MKRIFTFMTLSLCVVCQIFAIRPTVPASSLSFINVQCNSVTLKWSNGNGNSRLIVGRESQAPDFTPLDFQQYIATPNFSKNNPFKYGTGNDQFIVYNSNGNSARIDSLKQGKTYYFKIYEHDNNGSSVQYLISNPGSGDTMTHFIKPGFDITSYDSCQGHNLFRFKNTTLSSTTLPGHVFYFGDKDSSVINTVDHRYTISGIIPVTIRISTSLQGCLTELSQAVRIYQKKVVYFDFNKGHDTVQPFYNNEVYIRTGNYTNPLSGAYSYLWGTDNDSSLFSYFRHSYSTEGRRKVCLETTINRINGSNITSTGCKDTICFSVRILHDAMANISVNKRTQYLKGNSFQFSNIDSTLTTIVWDFGDGDTSHSAVTSHQYKDTGTYHVIAKGTDNVGDYHEKKLTVRVNPDQDTSGNPNNIVNLYGTNAIILYPNPSSGMLTVNTGGQSPAVIRVFDLSGKLLKTIEAAKGKNLTDIDLSNFENGRYVLELESAQHVKHIQIVTLSR